MGWGEHGLNHQVAEAAISSAEEGPGLQADSSLRVNPWWTLATLQATCLLGCSGRCVACW